MNKRLVQAARALPAAAFFVLSITACKDTTRPTATVASPADLADHCERFVGPPRVLNPAPGIWVAIGYDLANTTLIQTSKGNVIVDPGMSPARAEPVHAALQAVAPGPTAAIIYTHSHIDHIGGASVWAGEQTQIWATDRFRGHLMKQYGTFQRAEQRRGARQFGHDVPDADLPCSALGRRIDLEAALAPGIRMPTDTFSGRVEFEIGGVRIELIEAHGETDDQLFVWLPKARALLPGDNFYHAFPNIYTIRGTRPRPVNDWIDSLDAMRDRQPELLIPSHTIPVSGTADVMAVLTDYRDAIQWVRDRVVQGANAGLTIDQIATTSALPPHLAGKPHLRELYGQVDWSARAIYSNELGWFDENPTDLYPLPPGDLNDREIQLMGGPAAVLAEADKAAEAGDHRWALALLTRLNRTELPSDLAGSSAELYRQVLRELATAIANTNGRAYLLQSAIESAQGQPDNIPPVLDDGFLDNLPLSIFFQTMATRLLPAKSMDVQETVLFEFTENGNKWLIQIRNGIAEVRNNPTTIPATLDAHIQTDAKTWKKLALKMDNPVAALASGRLKVINGKVAFLKFIDRFDREF